MRSATARTASRVSIDEPLRNRKSSSGFFPGLGRILEVTESTKGSKSTTSGSDRVSRIEERTTRRGSHRDQATSSYRRPMKYTSTRDNSRSRNNSLPKINPSLLSVLSSATGTSSKSSNSSSTITPETYHRSDSRSSIIESRRSKEPKMADSTHLPNVFDFMERTEDPKTDSDARSTRSSSSVTSSSTSSNYQASDGSSSMAPDTPSSRSTFPPSPTTTRNQSVADLRKKYDSQHAASGCTGRSFSSSPAPSVRSLRKQPSVDDVPEVEEEEEAPVASLTPSDIGLPRPRSTSRSSRRSSRSSDGRRPQLETVDEYLGSEEHGHYVEPVHGQHRSYSASPSHSNRSGHGYHMAMQHYQWPAMPPPPMPPASMNGHIAPNERPPVPEAPDLSLRTITGYEEMALELSSAASTVKPIYRKFEYLNHRILLHLQDELSELEEQLRHLDEIIAQCDPKPSDGSKSPASRRGDNFYGGDIHLRRTHLLGDIFRKTEQYNRAMSAYTSMVKDTSPADAKEIAEYQTWMAKHTPVAEMEARFLQHGKDLIAPCQICPSHERRATKHAALAYLPVALMLPLLLFSIIPTIAGRLIVTALIAVGAFIVAATTRIRNLLGGRDWAVCGAVYVLLMGAVAGCIPQYH